MPRWTSRRAGSSPCSQATFIVSHRDFVSCSRRHLRWRSGRPRGAMQIPPDLPVTHGHNTSVDQETKKKIALWRFGVLGPLVSARLEHGDRAQWFREAAERVHQLPDGRLIKLSARTIESWFQAYRHGGFEALFPQTRGDCNTSRSIRAEVAD